MFDFASLKIKIFDKIFKSEGRTQRKTEPFWGTNRITLIKQILFYVGLTGILFCFSDQYSSILSLPFKSKSIIANSSLLLLFIKILLTKEKLWKYLMFLILIVLACVCDTNIGIRYHTIFIVVLILSSREIDIKGIVNYVFIFNCLFIAIHMFSYILFKIGLMDFLVIEKEFVLYRNNHLRHTFFLFHPNAFSNYLFWTYMMFVYLNFNNKKMRKVIVLVAIILSMFVYIFPVSRNACFFFIFSIILLFVYDNQKIRNKKWFCNLNVLLFVLCFTISFSLLILYNNPNILGKITGMVNNLLTGRIRLGQGYLAEYGTNLFGIFMPASRNMRAVGVERVAIDNWYYYMFIRLGLLFTFFYFFTFLINLWNFVKNKDFSKLCVILIFLLYNCIENIGINGQLAFPFFFLGMFL